MATNFFLTSVESVLRLTLNPVFATDNLDANTYQHRTAAGQSNIYRLDGQKYIFNIGLDFVLSADSVTINSWFQTNQTLFYTVNDSAGINEWTTKVRISNIEQPLNQYAGFETLRYAGTMKLKSVARAGRYEGFVFILDDSVYGRLDTKGNNLG